jgi:serine/threonine-protein kinase RsbW
MKARDARVVRLEIASRIDLLETVQAVLSQISGIVGFDEEAVHYMSVAVRESVVNAIKHGNRLDESKRVALEFTLLPAALDVQVRDDGSGFDPSGVPNPVAPENLLKADGRGIFFMRSFMDEVSYSFPRGGGTLVRMLKRLPEGQAEVASSRR